jgi:hypothetical protein
MALDPITAGIDLAGTVINKIWPDKSEAERAQLAAAVAMVQGQLDANKAEATSSSAFVAGWRPWIGWVCGMAFAWNWIGLPVATFVLAYLGNPITLSQADMTEMMPVLMGMLGLGALRSYEKTKGVAR